MNYQDMLDDLNHIPMFGAAGGLSNLKRYLELLGNPELTFKTIHVAGTNGKGSVCAYMESVLRHAGYKTALFTSPHLVRVNERFRINFEECEDEILVRAWEAVKELLDRREEHGLAMLTYFEIMFLMGMLVFSWEQPDYAIIETGLGGRLDATALVSPELCVITSISLDHTALLGDTFAKIAGEKAGIIKEGIPVVYLEENKDAAMVIREKAEEKHAKLLRVSYEDITFLGNEKNTIDFSMENRYYKIESVRIRTSAFYQTANASVALTAIHQLLPELSEEVMKEGLYCMHWSGRMEEIAKNIYVDGAHNPGAIEQICAMMRADKRKWKLLFAVCADKDYNSMVAMLSQVQWEHIYVTKIKTARGAGVDLVAECFRSHTDTPLDRYISSKEALNKAREDLKEDEQLLCLGSLYLVGELKKYLAQPEERKKEND